MFSTTKEHKMDDQEIEIVFDDSDSDSSDDSETEYVYVDFLRDSMKTFDSLGDLEKWFLDWYPSVFKRIEFGAGHYLKKDCPDGDLTTVREVNTSFKFNVPTWKGNTLGVDIKTIKFSCLFDRVKDKLNLYSNVCYKPRDHNLKKNEFNTWVEFVSYEEEEEEEEEKDTRLEQLLEFIKNIICSGDDESYKYIMSWLRHTVMFPWKKTEVCIFLQSPQGCGKGAFANFLKECVYGSHCSGVVCGLDPMVQKHNCIIAKKTFIFVDELPTHTGEFHSQFDKMKNLITEAEIYVEPKGMEGYNIQNLLNIMIATNNFWSLKLEGTDRRYFCQKVSDSKRGAKFAPYWDNLCNMVMTPETGIEFCRYLRGMKDEDVVCLRKIPETALRTALKESSKCVSMRFLTDVISGDFEFIEKVYFTKEFNHADVGVVDCGVDRDALYEMFIDWCRKDGEKSVKKRIFTSDISDALTPIRVQIDKSRKRVYNLSDIGYQKRGVERLE